jgi:mannose-1-phosphate guanylyltransferase / phosphomannomutase
MKAVLFATRALPALAPLTEGSCDALLSVACKPLIVHNIEALAMAGVNDVILAVSPNAHAVEAALGDGTRWGMRFEYELATADETEKRTLERIRHRLGGEYLVMRGEMLRTPLVAEFLERARPARAAAVAATVRGVDAGLKLIRQESSASGPRTTSRRCDAVKEYLEFPAARLALIDSLAEFHRANLDALDSAFAGLIVPGRQIAPSVRAGRHSQVSADVPNEARVLIGTRCRIASDAEFAGRVVVSDDVVISSRAILRDAIIMPNTYVGELVEVANAIVAGNRLIHVDTGTVAAVTDSFLLAGLRTTGVATRIRASFDRLLGAILLVASLGLWPIAFLLALVRDPKRPLHGRILLGNRQHSSHGAAFRAREFATVIPVLRYLPYLLSVVAGDLALIGVEPLEAVSAAVRGQEWELARDEGRVGLFGPVQLTAGYDMPTEERRIIEAEYVATVSFTEDTKWILRAIAALASRRAWRPAKRRTILHAKRPAAVQSRPPVRLAEESMAAARGKRADQSAAKILREARG